MQGSTAEAQVLGHDEAAVGVVRRLEYSQKEIVLRGRGKLLAWNTVRKR